MNESTGNKMAMIPMKRLFWKMGLPMIISMILQALYNVIDSIFVANMSGSGALANQALTIAFPIQILIIAIGVGTGVGLNAVLSKSLGEQNYERVNKTAGTGIFLSIIIYLVFLIFGIFGSEWFISLFTDNRQVLEMGTAYLRICTCFSLGSIGFTVYERFLQSTGKTMLSTIAQISGALINIVLDYIFIFPLSMGVVGAALATIIGQFVSLFIAMIFHYTKNKEIDGHIRYIKPNLSLIKLIYQIGIAAAIMQALLAVMMAGMNAILGTAPVDPTILVGSFGIYYKIQQVALFAAFGLSNTIISILSFNYGMKDKKRIDECIKYGIIDTVIVTLVITILFEILAQPLARLFGLAGGTTTEIIDVCTYALRIASIGYVFMGISVAIQGVLQSIGYATRPLVISLLRLIIFVFPIAYLFTLSEDVISMVWWTFPISEVLTSIIAIWIFQSAYRTRIKVMEEETTSKKLIVSISREHGTNGKEIARKVAKELNIAFYDKEAIKDFALQKGLYQDCQQHQELYDVFLSLDVNKYSILNLTKTIKAIAQQEDCVIVGRAADYILRDDENLIKIFLYAPLEYRVEKIKELYDDSDDEAMQYIQKSDKARSDYYELISNQVWGDKEYYDLCLNCKLGNEEIVKIICDYVKNFNK